MPNVYAMVGGVSEFIEARDDEITLIRVLHIYHATQQH